MQEEVENRTVTLAISTTRMTANVLKAAISKYLAYRKEKKTEKARAGPVKPCGKQSVKQLVGQDQGVANIEITDKNIKDFERIARKYGIDFALKKDKTGEIPKYLVFFKARDGDALTAAFKEYTAKSDRKKERPSVLQKLRKFKEQAADIDTPKVRKKELDAR
ncbi:MAG: PcfB family protein [Oscillospiraceae bacterium]|nr:PcfB family protein [Oscillospiraceae bacterium]